MPDKDEFTFDDKDDLPETDLSDVFADAEQESLDLQQAHEEPDATENPDPSAPPDAVNAGPGEELPPLPEEPKAGASRSRMLLLILLLVVAVAAGAYYLLGLGVMSSEAPQSSQSQARQVVAVPPPPPAASAPPVPVSSAAVAGDRPEQPSAETSAPPAAAGLQQQAAEASSTPAVPVSAEPAPGPAAEAAQAAAQQLPPAQGQPAAEGSTQAAPPVAAGQKNYSLDAGAFLFPAQREEIKNKIRELGYKPVESDVKASVRLIRLRMGSYTKEQLADALDQVASLTNGGFSLEKDGQYLVYAGSFADLGNVQRLKQRFLEKGITLTEEPVKVDKVLSLIRFGSFATEAGAEQVVKLAEQAGIPVRVIVSE